MKRAVTVIFFSALAALGGCTSTSAKDSGCYGDDDCPTGYLCDDHSGECLAPTIDARDACSAPTDCVANYTCGKDARCLPGDCYFNGCVTGFQCQSSTGTWECLPATAGAAGASSNEDATEAGTAGVVEAGAGG